jgi:methionyl-tRNA formyltransferase
MNQKGLAVVEACGRALPPGSISLVVGDRDRNVKQDYFAELMSACSAHGIPFADRSQAAGLSPEYGLAVGWRWLIHGCEKLIVLHDSLLPRYRGFAPLPAALINGDPAVGVTALLAAEEYDRGGIIAQKTVAVTYPIKIQQVIDRIAEACAELALPIVRAILDGVPLITHPQDEAAATYSPWRDEDDYRIDWSRDAREIQRTVDAMGPPYKGASSELDGVLVRVLDAAVDPDVKIEQRAPGKVTFVRDGLPIVACGAGMLRLLDVRDAEGVASILPLRKFRSRFR